MTNPGAGVSALQSGATNMLQVERQILRARAGEAKAAAVAAKADVESIEDRIEFLAQSDVSGQNAGADPARSKAALRQLEKQQAELEATKTQIANHRSTEGLNTDAWDKAAPFTGSKTKHEIEHEADDDIAE